jgi:hypothetical protein
VRPRSERSRSRSPPDRRTAALSRRPSRLIYLTARLSVAWTVLVLVYARPPAAFGGGDASLAASSTSLSSACPSPSSGAFLDDRRTQGDAHRRPSINDVVARLSEPRTSPSTR